MGQTVAITQLCAVYRWYARTHGALLVNNAQLRSCIIFSGTRTTLVKLSIAPVARKLLHGFHTNLIMLQHALIDPNHHLYQRAHFCTHTFKTQ